MTNILKRFRQSSGCQRDARNLQGDGGGIVGAIGWTGDWLATFTPSADGKSVRIQAGMWKTHFLLHPGEEIRLDQTTPQTMKGSDLAALKVNLSSQPGSAVVFYHRQK